MDATSTSKAWVLRAIGTAFGVATQLLFLITVYFLFFFLHDGENSPSGHWLVIDCVLALQFAVVHSILLLPCSRSLLARYLPAQFYGSIFAATTCVGLGLMFRYWRASPSIVWEASGWGRAGVTAGFYVSWALLFYSLKQTGFGYQTGWTQWLYWLRRESLPRREFVDAGIYRWMRHPAYLSFLGLIWFTPRMTADHAVLTTSWTIYILIGSYLKDQRLLFYLGDTYRRYASQVPGYPGLFFCPLGKWVDAECRASTSSIASESALPRAA